MAATIDELTIAYTENGVETVKELDKHVLTRGAWSTIVYRIQEFDAKKQEYGPTKYSIRRYQKRQGEYKQKSKFNISNIEQAKKLIGTLQNWIEEEEQQTSDA